MGGHSSSVAKARQVQAKAVAALLVGASAVVVGSVGQAAIVGEFDPADGANLDAGVGALFLIAAVAALGMAVYGTVRRRQDGSAALNWALVLGALVIATYFAAWMGWN